MKTDRKECKHNETEPIPENSHKIKTKNKLVVKVNSKQQQVIYFGKNSITTINK